MFTKYISTNPSNTASQAQQLIVFLPTIEILSNKKEKMPIFQTIHHHSTSGKIGSSVYARRGGEDRLKPHTRTASAGLSRVEAVSRPNIGGQPYKYI